VLTTSGADVTLTESSIEGANVAYKASSGNRIKLNAGSRVAGKRGGLITESSCNLEGTSTSIEGGAGPAFQTTMNSQLVLHGSIVKGTPGLSFERNPSPLDLAGTRVDGGQTVTRP
jgi:hypothetical protein